MVSCKTGSLENYLALEDRLQKICSTQELSSVAYLLNRLLRSIYREIERESLHTHQTEGKTE